MVRLGGALSIIIDSRVQIRELPPWMRRCLAPTITQPKIAVYTIQNYLIQLSDGQYEPLFVGREDDIRNYGKLLIPDIEEPLPRVLVLTGLEGIGRKTFARRVVQDYLSLKIGPTFIIEETDTNEKLYLQLMSETTDFRDRKKVAEVIKNFRDMGDLEKGEEIARLIAIINESNQIPVIVDKGPESTFLDNASGCYKEGWLDILRGLREFEDCYVLIIQPRLPYFTGMIKYESEIPKLAVYRLGPLSSEDIELLLREGARRRDIKVTTEQIKEVARYVNGYPPAATHVLAFMQRYGADILVANKAILNSFLARQFDNLLLKINLNEKEKDILRILEAESTLPLKAVSLIINCSTEETASFMTHLIDLSLVIPINSEYMISSPIRVAVAHIFGILTKKEFSNIAAIMRREFWMDESQIPTLSIVDATIHALAYSDVQELNDFRDIIMPTQILRSAWRKYNAHYWRDAEDLARRALTLDSRLYSARIVLFKSLVRQRNWRLAEEILDEIDSENRIDRYYLRGFMEWRRGHHQYAVSLFKHGLNIGDTTYGLLRDLAYCLFVLGELDDAKKYVEQALERNRNKYTLDLAAQIAIFSDRKKDAEDLLSELFELDLLMFHNRRATLLWKEEKYEEALVEAEIACDTEHPAFEAIVQKIDILILLDRPEAEEEIDRLEPVFAEASDIKRGLWCKYYLQRGEWGKAEYWWGKIWHKKLPSYQELRRKILSQKVEDKLIEPLEMQKSMSELSKLELQVSLPLVQSEIEEPEMIE